MRFISINKAICNLFGEKTKIYSAQNVSGGDINKAQKLILSDGSTVFLKSNLQKGVEFFEDEAEGLAAIRSSGAIRVPDVLAIGTDEVAGAFLILEDVKSAGKSPGYWEIFAQALHNMHEADAGKFVKSGKYGFLKDNYIGSRRQINTPSNEWITFFREYRLKDRFEGASEYFDSGNKRKINHFLEHLDKWLVEPGHPSLLHGDLWSGNVIVGNDGEAWLIDPAVYVGHAEADIAMTELFGGFSDTFYEHYKRYGGMEYGYEDRRNIYNLYHLLNHLISFGRSYYSAVIRILEFYNG